MTASIEEIVQSVRDQIADRLDEYSFYEANALAEKIRNGFLDSYGSPAKQRGENLNPSQMHAMQTDRGHGEENS